MTDIRISIPGLPIAKGRPKFRRTGNFVRAYTPKKTVDAENVISSYARVAMGATAPLSGPIRVKVECVMPIPPSWPKRIREAALEGRVPHLSRPDWENLGKVCDALNGIVWHDDSQVTTGIVTKRYGAPARTDITIQTVDIPDMVLAPRAKAKS